jgi:hypothetical protein
MTLTLRGMLRNCRQWNYSAEHAGPPADGLTGAVEEAVNMTIVTQADTRARHQQAVTITTRSPVRAAVLSLVTFSLYGFWWWWDINRQVKSLGQPAHPWRALAAVTAGWIAVVPPFWSVQRTATMIAAAEYRTGIPDTVSAPVALILAAIAAAGAAAWAVLSLAALPVGIYIGLAWPVLAMVFVGYLQRGLNRAAAERAGR